MVSLLWFICYCAHSVELYIHIIMFNIIFMLCRRRNYVINIASDMNKSTINLPLFFVKKKTFFSSNLDFRDIIFLYVMSDMWHTFMWSNNGYNRINFCLQMIFETEKRDNITILFCVELNFFHNYIYILYKSTAKYEAVFFF